MITIKKLKTLKAGTLRRKLAVLLQAFENDLHGGALTDAGYLSELCLLASEYFTEPQITVASNDLKALIDGGAPSTELIFAVSRLRHLILAAMGAEPADWDMSRSRSAVLASAMKPGRRFELYLDDIRSPFNLGSIFRTAEAFGVSRIMLSPDCPPPDHRRAERTSMGTTLKVPWERRPKAYLADAAASGRRIFALELGGRGISEFDFPLDGIAVIGSEELGISPEAQKAASESGGLVSIPIIGTKGSINVSVAFGIMMQRWSEI